MFIIIWSNIELVIDYYLKENSKKKNKFPDKFTVPQKVQNTEIFLNIKKFEPNIDIGSVRSQPYNLLNNLPHCS